MVKGDRTFANNWLDWSVGSMGRKQELRPGLEGRRGVGVGGAGPEARTLLFLALLGETWGRPHTVGPETFLPADTLFIGSLFIISPYLRRVSPVEQSSSGTREQELDPHNKQSIADHLLALCVPRLPLLVFPLPSLRYISCGWATLGPEGC